MVYIDDKTIFDIISSKDNAKKILEIIISIFWLYVKKK